MVKIYNSKTILFKQPQSSMWL